MTGDGPIRVLVVDDDPDVRLLLRVQLDLIDGITVVGEAADGEEALRLCAELHPDAVVMDLLMPRMNGFDAIAAIQRDHPGVGVVAYSAVAGGYARQRTAELGVEFVLKSGDPSELVAALRRAVAGEPGQ